MKSSDPGLIMFLPPTPLFKTPKASWEGKQDVLNPFSSWLSQTSLDLDGSDRELDSRRSCWQVCGILASWSTVWHLTFIIPAPAGQSLHPSLAHIFLKLLVFGAHMRVISKPEYWDHPGGISYHLPALEKELLYFAPRSVDDKVRIIVGLGCSGALHLPHRGSTSWSSTLCAVGSLWGGRELRFGGQQCPHHVQGWDPGYPSALMSLGWTDMDAG